MRLPLFDPNKQYCEKCLDEVCETLCFCERRKAQKIADEKRRNSPAAIRNRAAIIGFACPSLLRS